MKGILKPQKESADDDEIVKPVKRVESVVQSKSMLANRRIQYILTRYSPAPLYDKGGPYKLDHTDDCLSMASPSR